jgi:hypothetical protein
MEETYLFNPFVTKCSDEAIANAYKELQSKIIEDCKSPREYAHNIEVYANMNYLIGEMIARYTYEYNILKTNVKINESQKLYEVRTQWSIEHTEKAPALSYFEALATKSVEHDLKKLAYMESQLKRFKNAYDSIQDKNNAIKKQLDAIKYETI